MFTDLYRNTYMWIRNNRYLTWLYFTFVFGNLEVFLTNNLKFLGNRFAVMDGFSEAS